MALFFTENMSLRAWHESGLIRRDALLYEKLCEQGYDVTFVTYGARDDADYLPSGSAIQVLTRPPGIPLREYSWTIHRVHGAHLRKMDVIKSHQVNGARYAVYNNLRLGKKPYIARCGYLPSYFLAQERAPWRAQVRTRFEEFLSFHVADAVCVPSISEIDYLRRSYGIRARKSHTCPNWVDHDAFRPNSRIPRRTRQVCYVGRFHPQKAPMALLEALRGIPDVELLMIGGGPLQNQIEERIAAYGLQARLLGRVSNEELPFYYQSSAVYVLPTRYEGGSPKTLLEAMACGLPVVSTDGFGVREVFEDGVHGYKVPVDNVGALRDAIIAILDHPDEGQKMGVAAREHVIRHYGIERALEREIALLTQLA